MEDAFSLPGVGNPPPEVMLAPALPAGEALLLLLSMLLLLVLLLALLTGEKGVRVDADNMSSLALFRIKLPLLLTSFSLSSASSPALVLAEVTADESNDMVVELLFLFRRNLSRIRLPLRICSCCDDINMDGGFKKSKRGHMQQLDN